MRWFNSKTSERTPPGDAELAIHAQDQPPKRLVLKGFPSLATFMASNSNSESFIFRRFDRLAARNLLYLQSELAYLQEKLDELDRLDCQGPWDPEARKCARLWEEFERVQESSPKQRERWKLIKRIRDTLREYQETLLRQSQVAALETPSTQVLDAFNTEFGDTSHRSLLGASKDIYEASESNMRDLAQLHSTERKDRVSTFITKHMFRWLQTTESLSPSEKAQADYRLTYIHSKRLDTFVETFYAILSVVLLLGAILSLYFIQSPPWRIAIIVLFTLIFAICAVFFADRNILAVFGASAAYAAVLVVFVSGEMDSAVKDS